MNAQSGKFARRRRKPQRHIPHVVEERQRRPFLFGMGSDLTARERESLKERIALVGGIVLAVVIAGIIGYGLLYDTVIQPAQQATANSKPIAIVGNYTISTGFFKRFEKFRYNDINSQVTQLQSQLSTYQADPKKNAAQIQATNQQITQLQSALGTIPTDALTEVVNDQVAIQRGATVGVRPSAKAQSAANARLIQQTGGPRHFAVFIQQSGLSRNEIDMLLIGGYLQAKIQKKVAAGVAHTQTEVRASHILLPANKHALALQLYHELQHGANIAPLAKKYSIDKASAVKGGDLGYFPQGQMVAPFNNLAFSLKVGQVGLVKSQFGWHVVKVTGRAIKALSPRAYQQAQQSAYLSWQTKQKAALHVQYIVTPTNLPSIATPTTVPGAPVNPIAPVVPPSQGAPITVPGHTNPAPGHVVIRQPTTKGSKPAKKP